VRLELIGREAGRYKGQVTLKRKSGGNLQSNFEEEGDTHVASFTDVEGSSAPFSLDDVEGTALRFVGEEVTEVDGTPTLVRKYHAWECNDVSISIPGKDRGDVIIEVAAYRRGWRGGVVQVTGRDARKSPGKRGTVTWRKLAGWHDAQFRILAADGETELMHWTDLKKPEVWETKKESQGRVNFTVTLPTQKKAAAPKDAPDGGAEAGEAAEEVQSKANADLEALAAQSGAVAGVVGLIRAGKLDTAVEPTAYRVSLENPDSALRLLDIIAEGDGEMSFFDRRKIRHKAMYHKSILLRRLGRFDEALEAITPFVERAGLRMNSEFRRERILILAGLKRYADVVDARKDFMRSFGGHGQDNEAAAAIAKAFEDGGIPGRKEFIAEVDERFTDAIKHEPTSGAFRWRGADAWFGRGEFHELIGDKEKAVEHYKKAFELDPKFREASKRLKALGVEVKPPDGGR